MRLRSELLRGALELLPGQRRMLARILMVLREEDLLLSRVIATARTGAARARTKVIS